MWLLLIYTVSMVLTPQCTCSNSSFFVIAGPLGTNTLISCPPPISPFSFSLHHHARATQNYSGSISALLSTLQTLTSAAPSAWSSPEACTPPCPALIGRSCSCVRSQLSHLCLWEVTCDFQSTLYVRQQTAYRTISSLPICLSAIPEAQWGSSCSEWRAQQRTPTYPEDICFVQIVMTGVSERVTSWTFLQKSLITSLNWS